MEFGIRVNNYSVSISVLPKEFLFGVWQGNYLLGEEVSKDIQIGAIFVWLIFRKYETSH
jgi:hypothetical protein